MILALELNWKVLLGFLNSVKLGNPLFIEERVALFIDLFSN